MCTGLNLFICNFACADLQVSGIMVFRDEENCARMGNFA
jgi:hypothetical protein